MAEIKKLKIAVVGYGNLGKGALEAIEAAPDLKLAGLVRRTPRRPQGLQGIPVVADIQELGPVDAALLCVPSRAVPQLALKMAELGIDTVDSYDLHGDDLVNYRLKLNAVAKACGTRAVVAAGWDPGTDSLVRALMEFMAPQGLTFTNFGPGLSLGHSVAAANIKGVKKAVSLTIPLGAGLHRRLVYVELESGADLAQVGEEIKSDPYFARDETHVYEVASTAELSDPGHGVSLERKGISGRTGNQRLRWQMQINNPALTSQVMAAAARAGQRQAPGAYTMLQIPLIDYLFGEDNELIRRLV